MNSNRRSFLKGVAGVFGMATGGALLPKVSNADASDKVFLVNGREIAKYVYADTGLCNDSVARRSWLSIYIKREEWDRLEKDEYPFLHEAFSRDGLAMPTITLYNNGITRRFRAEYMITSPCRSGVGICMEFELWKEVL